MKRAARIVGASGVVVIECALWLGGGGPAHAAPPADAGAAPAAPSRPVVEGDARVAALSAEVAQLNATRAAVSVRQARIKGLVEPMASLSSRGEESEVCAHANRSVLAAYGLDLSPQEVSDLVAAIGRGGSGGIAAALFICTAISEADLAAGAPAQADGGVPRSRSRHADAVKRLARAAAERTKLDLATVSPLLDAIQATPGVAPVARADLELPADITGSRVASSLLALINKTYSNHLAKLAARSDAASQELLRLQVKPPARPVRTR